MYAVIDIKTGATIKTYPDDKARIARAYAHKRDAEYGAVRYVVRWFAQ